MKRLTCEMCGSTDLIKQDGVFVCQSCGCKYSVEEARKLMIEGPVEVHGTVQVDRNAELENRLKNAVSEYDAKNFERAATLFTEILNIDSNNAMAIAYKAAADCSEHANMQDTMLHRTVNEFTRAVNCSKELKDPELFGTVTANGYSVEWKNGQDICPDDLYYHSTSLTESSQS